MVVTAAAVVLLSAAAPAWEAGTVLDPTPEEVEEILSNFPLGSLKMQPGCAEYGTPRAAPGCYQAEKKIGKLDGSTFTVTLVGCAKPDVDCEGLLFEMWRRSRKSSGNVLDQVND
jgi:hypothetical protein